MTSASVLDFRRCSPGNRLKIPSYQSRVWRVNPLVVSGNIDTLSILLPLPSGALSLSAFNFADQLLSVADVQEPRYKIQVAQPDQVLGQIPAVHIRDGWVVAIEIQARV